MFKFLSLFLLIGISCKGIAQSTSHYSYLKNCYKGDVDVSTENVETLGSLKVYSISGEPGVSISYFDVPKDFSSISKSEIISSISSKHIEKFKSFSDVQVKKSYQVGDVAFAEIRLLCHWKNSDSYLETIFIYDGISVYEISAFKKTNDSEFFDKLINAIKLKNCPQDL